MQSVEPPVNNLTASAIFEHYLAMPGRLPKTNRIGAALGMSGIVELTEHYDAFVFDAFGVLNVGNTAIPGATAAVAELQSRGKAVYILTNAATQPRPQLLAKFAHLGFTILPEQIVSSRDALLASLSEADFKRRWGVIAPQKPKSDRWPRNLVLPDEAGFSEVDGYLFLSTSGWTDAHQMAWEAMLMRRPRPVYVGNPDLVAPRESDFSIEPGYYSLRLPERLFSQVRHFGKPYVSSFDLLKYRLERDFHIADNRKVLMVGDTLHTDILGGFVAGFDTALVTGHGFLKTLSWRSCCERSGLFPDWVMTGI